MADYHRFRFKGNVTETTSSRLILKQMPIEKSSSIVKPKNWKLIPPFNVPFLRTLQGARRRKRHDTDNSRGQLVFLAFGVAVTGKLFPGEQHLHDTGNIRMLYIRSVPQITWTLPEPVKSAEQPYINHGVRE